MSSKELFQVTHGDTVPHKTMKSLRCSRNKASHCKLIPMAIVFLHTFSTMTTAIMPLHHEDVMINGGMTNQEYDADIRDQVPVRLADEFDMRVPADIIRHLIANTQAMNSVSAPRSARSPLSPPTVTSFQPHRKGVSSRMQDPTLLVGRQSEGPAHPFLMRKAPPRQNSASTLLLEPENIARPQTMHLFPKTQFEGIIQLENEYLQRRNPNNEYLSSPPVQVVNPDAQYVYPADQYANAPPPVAEHQHSAPQSRDLISRNHEDSERLSRQRRVEKSPDRSELGLEGVRHGRFDNFLGETDQNSHNNIERLDTFGHPIYEHTWSGPKRSASPYMHPAARAIPNRNRQPTASGIPNRNRQPTASENNGIWSSNRPQFDHRFLPETRNSNTGSTLVENVVEYSGGNTGRNAPIRPGMRMPSRGYSPKTRRTDINDRVVVTGESVHPGVSHPRMLRVQGQDIDQGLENSVSVTIEDITDELNLNYEQLTELLNSRNMTLTNLYQLTSSGTPMTDILRLLQFESNTMITPITQTIDPIMWEIDQKIETEERQLAELEKQNSENQSTWADTTYSDSIYASGIYPINEIISDTESENPIDYYSEDEQQYVDGQAKIDSLTVFKVEELHPHYTANRWDSLSDDSKSRPLTYAIIAASAIMSSLAVFTLFVLIAYTIVKCTKKPTLNNYQVSTKKPVEVTT